MLFKILIFSVIIAAIYLRFFYKPKPKRPRDTTPPPEVMVECATCGTFISPREVVIQDGRYFCSSSCALIAQKEPS